jgi:hypothetical protein
MARHPSQRTTDGSNSAEGRGLLPTQTPLEHVITRLNLLPTGSAAEFMAELEDETEEPTPALRELLREVAC